jgi:hypothetical protein
VVAFAGNFQGVGGWLAEVVISWSVKQTALRAQRW